MPSSSQLAPLLWNLCDILRDDGITYHQYINELSYLLFLKMAQETAGETALPQGCRWRVLSEARGDEQFRLYRRMLVELGTSGPGTVRDIFANPTSLIRRARTLNLLVGGIDKLDWHDTSREGFGDIYEELLKYSAEKRSGAGQYFTPRVLVDSIIRVVKPRGGEVIQDPALGTAGFLVAAHQYLLNHRTRSPDPARYVGVELVPENFRIALMNAFVHGMAGEFFLEDTLSSFAMGLTADVVLTNPPFGTKRGGGGPTRTDLPFPTSNKQLAFVQHIIQTLSPGGRAGVVVPDNVLFEGGVGRQVRLDLMERCNLHTILRLPPGIFYAQGVKTNVLFFTRGANDQGNTDEVWIYDLRTNMPQFGKRTVLEPEHFAEFEKSFGEDPYGKAESLAIRQDTGEGGRFRKFTREQVRQNGDNLDIFWLKDERTSDDEFPDPSTVASEAIFELEGALDDLRAILIELGDHAEVVE